VVGDPLRPKEGYTRTMTPQDWNADDILNNIKEGVEEWQQGQTPHAASGNRVLGWVQGSRLLMRGDPIGWYGRCSQGQGASPQPSKGVNTTPTRSERDGFSASPCYRGIRAGRKGEGGWRVNARRSRDNSGKRYEDLSASTDRIAEYGSTALVGEKSRPRRLGLSTPPRPPQGLCAAASCVTCATDLRDNVIPGRRRGRFGRGHSNFSAASPRCVLQR